METDGALLDAIVKLTGAVQRLAATFPKLAYNAAEAAAQVGVSAARIYEMVADSELGKVPHMGARILIPHAELARRFSSTAIPTEES